MLLALAAITALPLDAQTPGGLTFDAAFRLAWRQNANLTAVYRQQSIREAQRDRDAARPRASADAPCTPLCAGVMTSLHSCGVSADRELSQAAFTDHDVMAAARLLRRNVREAFYDLLVRDEEIRVIQSLISATKTWRAKGGQPFDGPAGEAREALVAEIVAARSNLDLIRAEGERRMAQTAFNAILNRAPDAPVVLIGAVAEPVALPSFEAVMRLAGAFDVPLIRLREDLRHARAIARSAGTNGASEDDARVARLDARRAARARLLESCINEGFAQIDATRRAAARFEQTLIPAATDVVARAAEQLHSGHALLSKLLDAERALVLVRREHLQALHDLRLLEADVEERLAAGGTEV